VSTDTDLEHCNDRNQRARRIKIMQRTILPPSFCNPVVFGGERPQPIWRGYNGVEAMPGNHAEGWS
jgi:hypothetical protein